MSRGRAMHAINDKDRCEAITILTEWKRANKVEPQCPFFAKLIIDEKRLCSRHAMLEAIAVLLTQGNAQIIPRPETRIPWQAVRTMERKP